MNFLKKSFSKIIAAVVVLVVGILCIVAGASSGETSASAYEGISLTLGISLLVLAAIVLILALVAAIMTKGDASFGAIAIGSAVTLALGIFFIANKGLGGELIWLFLNFVPYVLIVVGAIIIVDAVLGLIFGIVNKNIKAALSGALISIIIGLVAVILGALMIGNDPVISKNAQLIIFGIIIVFYALSICATVLLASKLASSADEKKDSIDVEVKVVKEDVNASDNKEENKEEKAE